MPKFRNIGAHDVDAFRPGGDAQSRFVAKGATVEVPGTVVAARRAAKDGPPPEPLPVDAYVVEHNGVEMAWPHAQWELVPEQDKTAKTALKEN